MFRLMAGPLAPYQTVVQHWDAMSISLSAYGQPLIVDPGKGFLMYTEHHSSVLIDGKGQETFSRNHCWPALIEWHEKQDEMEYTMASATNLGKGVACDGYEPCTVAERHALVMHKNTTPFYAVICDIFEYPQDMAEKDPVLGFVLITPKETTPHGDDRGATIDVENTGLRVEIVTHENTTYKADRLKSVKGIETNQKRLTWSRRDRYGRMLAVLIPLKKGVEAPSVELVEDSREKTACIVRFGKHTDHITFWAPRPYIEIQGPVILKTGIRMKVIRQNPDEEDRLFTIPTLPGNYVTE